VTGRQCAPCKQSERRTLCESIARRRLRTRRSEGPADTSPGASAPRSGQRRRRAGVRKWSRSRCTGCIACKRVRQGAAGARFISGRRPRVRTIPAARRRNGNHDVRDGRWVFLDSPRAGCRPRGSPLGITGTPARITQCSAIRCTTSAARCASVGVIQRDVLTGTAAIHARQAAGKPS